MNNQFGYCAKVASSLRSTLLRQTKKQDPELYHQLMKLVVRIVAQDTFSGKGECCVTVGLKTEAGQIIANSFIYKGINIVDLLKEKAEEIERTWIFLRPFNFDEHITEADNLSKKENDNKQQVDRIQEKNKKVSPLIRKKENPRRNVSSIYLIDKYDQLKDPVRQGNKPTHFFSKEPSKTLKLVFQTQNDEP